jgi:flagellar hook-associated protein 3 FlgL
MIGNLDPSSEVFLASLTREQRRLERAERQVSSGRRIESAADAPDQIDILLQLRAAQAHNGQIQTNLGRAKTEADTAESTLGSAAKLLDRALVLAGQALNPAQTADSRTFLAGEVRSIQEQLVTYTQTVVEGRLIFSGDRDNQAMYQLDGGADTGVARQFTGAATRRIEDPAGGTFAAAKTAQEIFDARNPDDSLADGNIFSALAMLHTALLGDDSAAVGDALSQVRQGSDHLQQQIAFYGSAQTRIQDATSFAGRYALQLKSEISSLEDADMTTAALELTQTNTQIQAALSARAKMPRTSLFDLLG